MFYEVKILETAKQYRDKGMKWFESYQQNHNEAAYEMSMHNMTMADGLLEAYGILTGRRVISAQIENELSNY